MTEKANWNATEPAMMRKSNFSRRHEALLEVGPASASGLSIRLLRPEVLASFPPAINPAGNRFGGHVGGLLSLTKPVTLEPFFAMDSSDQALNASSAEFEIPVSRGQALRLKPV